jgi:hypothetical protein
MKYGSFLGFLKKKLEKIAQIPVFFDTPCTYRTTQYIEKFRFHLTWSANPCQPNTSTNNLLHTNTSCSSSNNNSSSSKPNNTRGKSCVRSHNNQLSSLTRHCHLKHLPRQQLISILLPRRHLLCNNNSSSKHRRTNFECHHQCIVLSSHKTDHLWFKHHPDILSRQHQDFHSSSKRLNNKWILDTDPDRDSKAKQRMIFRACRKRWTSRIMSTI